MEMILLIFFATLSFSFGLSYWATFNKLKKSNLIMAELFIKNRALEELNSQANNNINMSDDTLHKENFIKFLSDSRDWAFEYIENVQAGLNTFINGVEPEINYFKEYSDTMVSAPNYYSMKKITEEYEKLKSLLPEESKKENEK